MEIDFIMRNMFSVIIVDFLSQHTDPEWYQIELLWGFNSYVARSE